MCSIEVSHCLQASAAVSDIYIYLELTVGILVSHVANSETRLLPSDIRLSIHPTDLIQRAIHYAPK
jgi:hypothetical protein